jgi:hypothetical protein
MSTVDPFAIIGAAVGADTPPAPPPRAPVTYSTGNGGAYAQRALEAECERVSGAQPGERNHTLNRAAFSLGQLVAGGALEQDEVVHALSLAAHQAGLDDLETRRTIASGLKGGSEQPRGVPERPDAEGWVSSLPGGVTIDVDTGEVTGPGVEGLEPLRALDLNLLHEPCPEPEWLVEGRMTRNSLTLLGSKPGIGKSWTALDLAIALATGRPWLGCTVPGTFRVLYIDVENGEVLARRRLQQLGADPAALGNRLHYVTESVIFPGGKDSVRYALTLEQFKPDLVVIDTLASSAPAAESDTESMSRFLFDVWHRARRHGAACLILAHLRKSQQGAGKDDPLDSFRGAGHLVGAASRAWLLDARGGEKFVLRDVKTREFPAVPPTRVWLQDTELPSGGVVSKRTAVVVDGIEEEDSPEGGLVRFQRNVLTMIDNHPTGVVKAESLLTLGDGETSKTLRNYLTEMVAAGVLTRPRRGFYSRATGSPYETQELA